MITFDTHRFVRRLEEAGMTTKLAEVQAELLTEAFAVNLEFLVTKDFLDSRLSARFTELDARNGVRFAEQDARIDTRFGEQVARIEARFAEQDARIDSCFVEQHAYMDGRFALIEAKLEGKIDSNYRIFVFTQAIVMAAVILPYVQRFLVLQGIAD